MPRYQITAPDGRVVTVEGDTPPTEADADQIFANLPPKQKPTDDNDSRPGFLRSLSQGGGTPEGMTAQLAKDAPQLGGIAVDTGLQAGGASAGQAAGALAGPLAPLAVPIGGAIGGGLGDYAAQKRRMALGEQDKLHYGELLAAAGTGAIPGSGIIKAGGRLVRAAEGAGISSAANTAATAIDQKRLPTMQEALLAGGLGAAGGAVTGGNAESPAAAANDITPEMREAILARQRLSDAHGVTFPNTLSERYPSLAPIESLSAQGVGGGPLRGAADARDTAVNKIQQDLTDGALTPTQIGAQLRSKMANVGEAQAAVDAANKVSPEMQAQLKQQIAERTSGVSASDPSLGANSLTGAADQIGARLDDYVQKAKDQAAADFGAFNQSLAKAGLDGKFVKLDQAGEVAQKILNDLPQAGGDAAEGFTGQATAKLRGIIAAAQEPQTIDQAMTAKSIIGQAIANPNSDLGQGVAQGQLKQLYKALNTDIDDAVQKAPGAQGLLKRAIANYKDNVEQFEQYGIGQANVSGGDKAKNIVSTVLSQLQNKGESQVYDNLQNVLGPDGMQPLNDALKSELTNSAINKATQTYNVEQYLNSAQTIRRRSPEIADAIGLPSTQHLLDATMALKAVSGSNEITLQTLQEASQRPEIAAMLQNGDIDQATKVMKIVQSQKDMLARDVISRTLANTDFNMQALPDAQTIYRTMFRDPSVPASRVAGWVKSFELKANSNDVDAQEAANLLDNVRKTEMDNLFSSVADKPTFNAGASAKMEAQDSGDLARVINPAKLRSIVLSPADEAEKNTQQKLQAVLGDKYDTLKDLALALGPTQRSMESAGKGAASSNLLQWLGANPLSRAFFSRILTADTYPSYLTGKGQARRFFQSGQAVDTLTRQAFTQGSIENQALIGALQDNGMMQPNGTLTPDGQAALDSFKP